MGGEKRVSHYFTTPSIGSPPRGRGKALFADFQRARKRITPAWAGKRPSARSPAEPDWDHPRVGGEKFIASVENVASKGSPPRGRGKEVVFPSFCMWLGITPAWAGKSVIRPRSVRKYGDHPRVGGEKSQSGSRSNRVGGSPPRGRGKVSAFLAGIATEGITPAWAGKRLCRPQRRRVPPDHPRVGGEKSKNQQRIQNIEGSPPRGRGKGGVSCPCGQCVGITPAWAGKSRWWCRPCRVPWDHPRVGGEKLLFQLGVLYPLGSPPRWRGKALQVSSAQLEHGITPRVGGEKSLSTSASIRRLGSPPRWRGKVLR